MVAPVSIFWPQMHELKTFTQDCASTYKKKELSIFAETIGGVTKLDFLEILRKARLVSKHYTNRFA